MRPTCRGRFLYLFVCVVSSFDTLRVNACAIAQDDRLQVGRSLLCQPEPMSAPLARALMQYVILSSVFGSRSEPLSIRCTGMQKNGLGASLSTALVVATELGSPDSQTPSPVALRSRSRCCGGNWSSPRFRAGGGAGLRRSSASA